MSTSPTMAAYYPINGTELKEYILASIWKGLEGHPDLQMNMAFPRVRFKVTIELHMEPQETSQKTITASGELGDPGFPGESLLPHVAEAELDVGFSTSPEMVRRELDELRVPVDEEGKPSPSLTTAERLRNYLRPQGKGKYK